MFIYISISCLKKFNRAPLSYSLEALCRFQGGEYTHAALETVQNQLTIKQVFKTITILQNLELLYMSSTLGIGLPDVWLKEVC